MACPTCDHTMQRSGDAFWCPRCGTLRDVGGYCHAPKLVERCQQFERAGMCEMDADDWITAGIAESINPPAGRPE